MGLKYFSSQPSLVEVAIPEGSKFTVCGDIHGQFFDLMNVFALNGLPSPENPYLFNGDFVDRGSFSVECIFVLFGFKLLYPDSFFMSRGNHESENMNKMYGFEGEVKAKYSSNMCELFTEVYNWLPLCHCLAGKVLVMHGGLFSKDNITLDDIRATERCRQPPEEGIMCELLWSDPQPMLGRSPSKRGVGCQFGPDVTRKFLDNNQLDYIIRSHEVKDNGYEVTHDGKCITVFSAPNYCDNGKQGGIHHTDRRQIGAPIHHLRSRGPPKCEADGLCELAAQPLWIVNRYLSLLSRTLRTPPTRLQRFAKSIFNTKWVQLGIFDRLRILLLTSL